MTETPFKVAAYGVCQIEDARAWVVTDKEAARRFDEIGEAPSSAVGEDGHGE